MTVQRAIDSIDPYHSADLASYEMGAENDRKGGTMIAALPVIFRFDAMI